MSSNESGDLEDLSRLIFGQRLRLPLMIMIARSTGPVCLTDLADALGVGNASRLQRPFDDLREAGLLTTAAPSQSNSTRRWYRRAESRAWGWVLELEEQSKHRR